MFGLKEASFLGFSVALAGGLAYVVWNYAFVTRESGERRPEDDNAEGRKRLSPGEQKSKKEESGDNVEQSIVVDRVAPACTSEREQKVPEQSKSVKPEGTQVLVLGLEGAGKSSLLYSMAIGSLDTAMEPTAGLNAVSINREDLRIEFLEIGGSVALRPYWSKYISRALLLVFVVDSAAPQLFTEAKAQLHSLLESYPCLPLMVLANKQAKLSTLP
ncbi:ADP-ribosylation factor-like protein 9 isoform X2 [Corythoichthys intestinalis]|uniref:ADP-ribosylation factor-like protein 9 isoform X2 n=1 Tax=Corythoichthys intestinalis TaxID=161448 RepID=UPI0025A5C8E0|nr:ADP-ribosylation factor-like protein 9 isoform X2 [Corythoichthys intestinalis]